MRILFLLLLAWAQQLPAADRIPGEHWMQYADVAEAGFDAALLAEARQTWESIPSSAFLVIADGAVVAAWGETERRFMCHSVRKSFLSGLYGIYWDRGEIELNKQIHELGIDEAGEGLLETEKTARILDLLKARSGVFHPAAYAGRTDSRPRGSEGPGRYFAYNNWDFNTLAAILEQETGDKVFEAFDAHFGRPLGMQDWDIDHGYYHFETDKSRYPAYPFRMSARDAARFGLLYARDGMWGEQRILSRHWIRRSSALYSIDSEDFGYGFMWWVARERQLESHGMFAALGVGNQMIAVLPDSGLVIVNRANTYEGEATPMQPLLGLIRQVLDARTGSASPQPGLVPMPEMDEPAYATAASPEALLPYVGEWAYPPPSLGLPPLASIDMNTEAGHLLTVSPQQGTFRHYLQHDGTLVEEDSLERYFPVYDEQGSLDGFIDDTMAVNVAVRAFAGGNREMAGHWMEIIRPFGGLDAEVGALILRVMDDPAEPDPAEPGLAAKHSPFGVARAVAFHARNLRDAGRLELAEPLFRLNTRVSPGIARVWEDLGDIQAERGETGPARASFERALEIEPGQDSVVRKISLLDTRP